MLVEEYGAAANIKSRVNRLSVQGAITSVQQRLKLYSKVPPNGLVVYCGLVCGTLSGVSLSSPGEHKEGVEKEKKVTIDFEPWKPLNTSLYMCGDKFECGVLASLLKSDDTWGFIVVDGHGVLYGTLSGNNREVLHKFSVELPKKHGRGGQSSVRFARLRVEKRANYIRKVAETATSLFIKNDKPTVKGIILAGSADFKLKLSQSDIFDPRLNAIVVKLVDISYGGENGFSQAIELSADILMKTKFNSEKELLVKYFENVANGKGKYCFGHKDTLAGLDQGAVEDLIVYEELQMIRCVMVDPTTKAETVVVFDDPDQEKKYHEHKKLTSQSKLDTDASKDKAFKKHDKEVQLECKSRTLFLDWILENYKSFGARLNLISNKTEQGKQFVKGFGGLGGLLRYPVDFSTLDDQSNNPDCDVIDTPTNDYNDSDFI